MLRPQGYISVCGFRQEEYDTVTCGHCNWIVPVKPGTASTVYLVPDPLQPFAPLREEPGAHCKQCDRAICLRCYADGRCTPLMRRIEAMEGNQLALTRLGMG